MFKIKIAKTSRCGTLESNDVSIVLRGNESDEIVVNLSSTVHYQYGAQIESVILNTLKKHNISGVIVDANDHGALDCTIVARIETALERAGVVIDD